MAAISPAKTANHISQKGAPPGQHELFLKIAWCTSQSLTFDAQPGTVIEFFCEPGGPASAGLQDVLGDTGQYITLTRVDRHTP
jgi:hypothetical protein